MKREEVSLNSISLQHPGITNLLSRIWDKWNLRKKSKTRQQTLLQLVTKCPSGKICFTNSIDQITNIEKKCLRVMLAPLRLSFVITGNPFFFGMQIGLQNLTTKEISSNSYRHGRVNHKCYMAICLKFFLFFFSFICLSMLLSPPDNCEPYLRQILNSLIPSFHFFSVLCCTWNAM